MKKTLLLLFAVLLVSTAELSAQIVNERYSSIADTIVSSALTQRQAYEWLKELCSIGPRLSGSKNLNIAIDWAKTKFEQQGFKLWLQPVMVPHWERGVVEGAEITGSNMFSGKKLHVASLGGSVGTPSGGITAGILEVRSFEELEAKKEQVNGKIVFFSRKMNETLLNVFDAYGEIVQFRSRGAIETARYGGVACLVRTITTKYDTVPHVGAIRKYADSIAKVPSATIAYTDADFLSEALSKDPSLQITLNMDCSTFPDVQSYNIIADIPGTEFPEEYVVVGGHFDSWDKGFGAHDDGAGCVQAIEVLNLFKRLGLQPKRTVRCIFYANEENGLRGALQYGAYSDSAKLKHLAAIESDAGGFSPRGFTVMPDSTDKIRVLDKINSWTGLLKKAGAEWVKDRSHGPADISTIKNSKALIGLSPDPQRYFDVHHSDNDVIEAVNPRELELGAAAMAILTYMIAEEGL